MVLSPLSSLPRPRIIPSFLLRRIDLPITVRIPTFPNTGSPLVMPPPPTKRQKREQYRQAQAQAQQNEGAAAVAAIKLPKKKFYRQRAHANPFSDHQLD